jgi:large subunit ribosomal protein L19
MSKANIIQKLEASQLKSEVCQFRVGDTIRVHTRIIEGEKERVQVFAGTVIARKGSGLSETFSVHRVAYGEGMERVFLLHSPRIAKIEVVQEGAVRRSKLYYLRGTSGKASKVKPRFRNRKDVSGRNNNSNAAADKLKASLSDVDLEQAVEVSTSNES